MALLVLAASRASRGAAMTCGRSCVKRSAVRREGGSNSVVESQPSKLLVAGSIPVSRSSLRSRAFALTRELRLASQAALRVVGWRCWTSGAPDLSAVARKAKADVAQLAERVLGKDEVTSSILVIGSNLRSRLPASA